MASAGKDADFAAAAAVAAVLRAPDHYTAIDAEKSAEFAELRKCYVRASMRVHPDKNSHPDATRAFQRVAAAWQELGDEQTRWRYDQQLSMGYGGSDDIDARHSDHMNEEEAFAAFARATAACGACGPFGDCADSLLFAQQMASLQSRMPQNTGGIGQPAFGAAPQQTLQSCGSGIAYSTGLWVAGVGVSAAGFTGVGGFMRRVAVVQGFGQVAIGGLLASQDPNVRTAIEPHILNAREKIKPHLFLFCERAAPVKVALANAGAAVRHKVEDFAASELVEQLESSLGAMPSCLPRRRLAAPEALRVTGTRVTLTGLQSTAMLNGRLCEVVRFDKQRERYVVRLLPEGVRIFSLDGSASSKGSHSQDGALDDMKLVKEDNLRLAPPIPSERAPQTTTQFI